MMFANKIMASFRKAYPTVGRAKRQRVDRVDIVAEQVKKVLATSDQKLILMVRS